jgi:hypothetical protein
MATPEEIAVVVTAEDFTAALRDLVPSVSQAEMAKYAQIRQRFSRSVNTVTESHADDQGSNIDTKGKGKGKGRDDGTSGAIPGDVEVARKATLHSAAERARIRRQQDEEERERERERARKKAE